MMKEIFESQNHAFEDSTEAHVKNATLRSHAGNQARDPENQV